MKRTAHPFRSSYAASIVFLALLIATPATAQDWTSIGPYTGEVRNFWPSPQDPELLFVRGNLDGDPEDPETMVSRDGGLSFETTAELRDLREIIFDPSDPYRLWALNEYEFLSSDDAGATWTATNLWTHGGPENGRHLAKQPGSDSVFVLTQAEAGGAGRDIYLTTNAGWTWDQVYQSGPSVQENVHQLVFNPHHPDRLYASRRGSTFDAGVRQLQLSTDLGATWTDIGETLDNFIELQFNPLFEGYLYAFQDNPVPSPGIAMVSTDDGETWQRITGPWSPGSSTRATAMTDGRLAVISEGGLKVQDYPGQPWWNTNSFDTSLFEHGIIHPHLFRVHPVHLGHLYAFTGTLFLRSVDMGETWSVNTDGFCEADPLEVHTCREEPGILLTNTGNALYISWDGGASWEFIRGEYSISGTISSTYAFGFEILSWTPFSSDGGSVLKHSSDSGLTWEDVNTFSYVVDATIRGVLHADHGYVIGETDWGMGVFEGQFQSDEWILAAGDLGMPNRILADPLDFRAAYAHTNDEIYRSTDSGASFSLLNDTGGFNQISLQPDGDKLVAYDGYFGNARLSNDRGVTFDHEFDVVYYNEGLEISYNGDLISYGYGGLTLSTNDGGDWDVLLDDQGQYVSDIEVGYDRTLYAVLGNRGLMKLPEALAVEDNSIANQPAQTFELAGVWPNPFNGSTTLALTLPQPAQLDLTVYDLLGRKVTSLLQHQQMTAGTHRIGWDAHGLASGSYLVHATSPKGGSRVVRVTLLK